MWEEMEKIVLCKDCQGFGCDLCDGIGIEGACRCAECHAGLIIFINEEGVGEEKLCIRCRGFGYWIREKGGGKDERSHTN